jgi:hypothetical protein
VCAGVGKSSIRSSFGGGAFNPRHDMTIGVEFESKVLDVQGMPVRISIYDTVRAVRRGAPVCYLLGSSGCMYWGCGAGSCGGTCRAACSLPE